jgi:putative colanic acid biosynthesis acetyltransferase WcaF
MRAPHDPLPANSHRPRDGGPSFSLRNRITRLVWNVVWWALASWTPAAMHPWRRLLLRLFGAKIGPRSDVKPSARVWLPSNLVIGRRSLLSHRVVCYNQAPITLGDDVLVSQGAHLCSGTHDYDDPEFQLVTRPIVIGSHSWLAAECFVGPGARINSGVVLGARAVAHGELREWTVYAGNPARPLRPRRRPVAQRSTRQSVPSA